MTADAWELYDHVAERIGDGGIDLDTDTFFVALVTSSYTPSAAHDTWSDISANEVAEANGYTTDGFQITPTWSQTSGVATFDSNDPTWTASGGSITARYAVLVRSDNDTTLENGDLVLAYCLLDNAPADVVAASGADFTIVLNANGYFQLTVNP
jgi:hypothetical protein